MPSDKERMAAKRAGIAAWNSGGPGGGNTFPLEFAIDAAIDALSAAEKEREGGERCETIPAHEFTHVPNGEHYALKAKHQALVESFGVLLERLQREGDIIEKLREWVEERHRRVAAVHGAEFRRGARIALDGLDAFLTDLREQSTPKEEACGQVGVGHGGDTWDPVCDLPAGHAGRCNWSGEPAQEQSTGEEQ